MSDIEKDLLKILNTMKIPESRKELTLDNCKWLGRNLCLWNLDHIELSTAIHLLSTLITMKGEKPFIVNPLEIHLEKVN